MAMKMEWGRKVERVRKASGIAGEGLVRVSRMRQAQEKGKMQ